MRVARRRLRLGTALAHMPLVEQAWESGAIGPEHVDVLGRARGGRKVAEVFARDEAMLVGHASTLTFRGFEQRRRLLVAGGRTR